MPPSMPPVPECLTREPHPEALRARHLSPSTPAGRPPPDAPEPATCTAWASPESPSRELSEWAMPREPYTERLPRTRRARHVSLGAFLFSRIFENTQKIVRTLEMHNKSNFDLKNVIPIFMALYCSVLPRKNTKPHKKTKLPLGKTSESKLCLFVSGRSLRPKFMKIYQ